MTRQTNSLTPECAPPADNGSAVVAHAESSSGAGTSFDLVVRPSEQESINHCSECGRSWFGLPFATEADQFADSLLLSLGVALPHDLSQFLTDDECHRRIDKFFGSEQVQTLAKISNRIFQICAQENISVIDALIADYVGGRRA